MLSGISERWLDEMRDVDSAFLDGVAQVWPDCRSRFGPDSWEDDITRLLVVLLKRHRHGKGRFLFDSQPEEVELDRNDEVIITRPDIKVSFTFDPDIFIVYECKRLNVILPSGEWRSLSGEYLDSGIMRFVDGQYATSLPFGAMLGYVLDGDVDRAFSEIHSAISRRESLIGLQPVAKPLPTIGGLKRFASVHVRRTGTTIEIHHALLPMVLVERRTLANAK